MYNICIQFLSRAGQVAMPGRGEYNTILNILHYFSIVNLDTHIGQHWE
jgi:hypothetical protein